MFGGDLRHANLLINSCLFWGFYGMAGGVHRDPLSVNRTFFWSLLISSPFEKIMLEGMLKKSYKIRRKLCPENQRSIKNGLDSCLSKQEMAK
jgi:hypothetical protein